MPGALTAHACAIPPPRGWRRRNGAWALAVIALEFVAMRHPMLRLGTIDRERAGGVPTGALTLWPAMARRQRDHCTGHATPRRMLS